MVPMHKSGKKNTSVQNIHFTSAKIPSFTILKRDIETRNCTSYMHTWSVSKNGTLYCFWEKNNETNSTTYIHILTLNKKTFKCPFLTTIWFFFPLLCWGCHTSNIWQQTSCILQLPLPTKTIEPLHITWIYHYRVYTDTPFGVSAINLCHRKFDLRQSIRIFDHKISCEVIDPVSRILQVTLGNSLLTIRSR